MEITNNHTDFDHEYSIGRRTETAKLASLGVFMDGYGHEHVREELADVIFVGNQHSKTAKELINKSANIIAAQFPDAKVAVTNPNDLYKDINAKTGSALFIAIGLNPRDFYKINKIFSIDKINWMFVYSPSFNMVTISNLIDYKHGCYKCFRFLHVGSLPEDHFPLAADIEEWLENDLVDVQEFNDIAISQTSHNLSIELIANLIVFSASRHLAEVVHTISLDDMGMEINRSASITLPSCDCCT